MILKSIGLMSGTSMDGIDAVIMDTNGKDIIIPKETLSLNYKDDFKLKLRQAEFKSKIAKKNKASLDTIIESTKLHASIINDLLEKAKLKAKDIDVIGYHGQALYHNPSEGISIQMGDSQLLADLTGIKVVNDFRIDDIKNGGQGAPLAPLYHQALAIKDSYFPVAIVNCGGISNISIVNGPTPKEVIGFDTGPGNVLIDRYIREKTNNKEFMDLDGKYGCNGSVNQIILQKLFDNLGPYFNKQSPKSLDSGDLQLIDELNDLSIEDACTTLEAFTAYCIANSLPKKDMPNKWILAGGGWNNPVILKYLKLYLKEYLGSVDVKIANEISWDNIYMEAEIFAYLAVRSLYKLPISLPSVTGAKKPSLGGTVYVPKAL